VDIRSYTLLSFAIGAAYAGVAGALFASLVQFIEPAPFTVGASIMMYLMVVVGGPGYFFGPVLGAAVGVMCRSGCASPRPGICSCSVQRWCC
jgi:branched-chain amino acid transport system permease protein